MFENEIYDSAAFTCINGTKLLSLVDKQMKYFEDLTCIMTPKSVARKVKNKKNNYCSESVYEIGFQLNREFIKIIDVCHDDKLRHTLMTHVEIMPVLDNSQKRRNVSFSFSDFSYTFKVNNVYKQKSQKQTFARILGTSMVESYLTGRYKVIT